MIFGDAERLIGGIRRECLGYVLVVGAGHLGRVFSAYAKYCKGAGTHLAIDKEAPWGRPVHARGEIVAMPVLS